MVRYTVKRCFMIIPIVFGVVFIVFLMLYFLPGSNISRMPSHGGGDALDAIFSILKAENTFLTRYARYCFNAFLRFDFGLPRSYAIASRVRMTLILTTLGIITALVIGVLAGAFAATHRNRWQDHAVMFLTLLFSSIPSYCIALILCIFFVKYLRILPLFGNSSPAHFILPVLTLAAGGIAMVARITRASLLDVLSQNYIVAIRAKGMKERAVVYIHALRNVLVPVVSMLGTLVAQLLFNTFVVEYFFSIYGISSLLIETAASRNHLAVLCSSVIIAVILSVIFIVTDLFYTLLNPKIKLLYTNSSHRKLREENAG